MRADPRDGVAAPTAGSAVGILSRAGMGGRRAVLALVETWSPQGEPALETLRAQLRGLGSALLVLASDAAWRVLPDGEPELLHGAAELRADAVRLCGADAALILVDEAGAARATGGGPVAGALAPALDALARSFLAREGRPALLWTRREWLVTSAAAGLALAAPATPGRAAGTGAAEGAAAAAGEVDVTLTVNGVERALRIEPRVSLLDALRERLELTGTKKGCDAGQCGACTVLVDGRRVLSCLTLAIAAEGASITTVEGLARGDRLHPVQAAFIAHDAFQCGYCTSGQIMSAVGLLSEGHATTDDQVREAMSGNICRCGAYQNIVAAIQAARHGA